MLGAEEGLDVLVWTLTLVSALLVVWGEGCEEVVEVGGCAWASLGVVAVGRDCERFCEDCRDGSLQ